MITKITAYDSNKNNIAFGNIWRTKINTSANAFVKKELTEQAESIISALFNFINAYKKHKLQNDDVLNNLFKNINEQFGIKKIYDDISEGIVFDSGEKNLIFSIHGEYGLRVREQNKTTFEIEKSVFLHENKLAKTDTKNTVPNTLEYYQYRANINEAEDYLSKIYDDIDFKLLQIRKKLLNPDIQAKLSKGDFPQYFIPRMFIRNAAKSKEPTVAEIAQKNINPAKPKEAAAEKIYENNIETSLQAPEIQGTKTAIRKKRKLKLIARHELISEKTSSGLLTKGKLKENDKTLTDEIINLFNEIHETLKNIKYSETRSKIKNGYPPIKIGMAGSKMLEFESIGTNHDNISVNLLNDHYIKHLVINVTSYNGKSKNIIVTPKGEVMKRPTSVLKREWHANVDEKANSFYTQDEIDRLNFSKYLNLLKNELSSYLEYINGRISSIKEKQARYSTSEEGSAAMYNDLFKSVYNNYFSYKKNIVKIHNTEQRAEIRNMFNIHTKKGNPSIVFRNITPENEDLHLSFPKINNETCIKILVLDKSEAIKKTLLVKDNKLVKFNADNIHSKKRHNRGFYYHTQEEINQSGLGEYLKIIDNQLKKVNSEINKA